MTEPTAPTVVGRYVLHAAIARGGMATIHLARLHGAEGFSRTVAAKRLHPQFTEDAEFLKMFLDEARIASKVHHPNVVPMLDVVQSGAEVILVQEYVHGVPFDKLLRAMSQQKKVLPVGVAVAIVAGTLAGLHAAHEAKDELGQPLGIVHRDVSPQNIIVGVDGIPRLLDFGVAKATVNSHVTRAGVFKGKLAYTSPEQLQGSVTQSADIYAASVVLWESLAGRRMYRAGNEAELVAAVMAGSLPALTEAVDQSTVSPDRWEQLLKLEPLLAMGLAFAPGDRFATAAEMHDALLEVAPAATPAEVSKWVKLLGKEYLEGREKVIVSEESSWRRNRSAIGGTATVPLEDPVERSAPGSGPGVASQSTATATALQTSLMAPMPAPPPGRSQWALVSALLVVGGLLGAILLLLVRSPNDAAPAAGVALSTTSTTLTAATVALPAPAPTLLGSAASEATSATSTAATSTAAAAARVTRGATPSYAAPRAAAPAPPPAVTGDCTPPFYFDGKKKIFKPGCL
jgi:serine/threonine-protein kinase